MLTKMFQKPDVGNMWEFESPRNYDFSHMFVACSSFTCSGSGTIWRTFISLFIHWSTLQGLVVNTMIYRNSSSAEVKHKSYSQNTLYEACWIRSSKEFHFFVSLFGKFRIFKSSSTIKNLKSMFCWNERLFHFGEDFQLDFSDRNEKKIWHSSSET